MQSLDGLIDGQIIITSTIRCDRLGKALLRRFQRQAELIEYNKEEHVSMIGTYMQNANSNFITDEIMHYTDEPHTQADIVKNLIEKIVEKSKLD